MSSGGNRLVSISPNTEPLSADTVAYGAEDVEVEFEAEVAAESMVVDEPEVEAKMFECDGRASQNRDCHPAGLDDDDVEHDAEEECEPPRALRNPGQPTSAQMEEHSLTHIPFRPWCKHCVRGKAKDKPSRRLGALQTNSAAPRVRLDYCMITDKS